MNQCNFTFLRRVFETKKLLTQFTLNYAVLANLHLV